MYRKLAGRSPSTRSVLAVAFLAATLLSGVPLRGQDVTAEKLSPFAKTQRDLELVVDEQLHVVRSPGPVAVIANAVSQAARVSTNDDRNPSVEKAGAPGLRFRSVGVDAERIFREEGLPIELLTVARVESNFDPLALSPKGARGLWQFMPATARRYGLRVDALRDDRLDGEKSTRAAARYLGDLYAQFKNWPLTLAAYNAGEDRVQRAIERAGSADFWALSHARQLPRETRAYVPSIFRAIQSQGESANPLSGGALRTNKGPDVVLFATSSLERNDGDRYDGKHP